MHDGEAAGHATLHCLGEAFGMSHVSVDRAFTRELPGSRRASALLRARHTDCFGCAFEVTLLQAPTRIPFYSQPLFDSFFLAGFECSDHVLENGQRLDLLASTRHEEFASGDYARLRSLGMTTCREGVSWVRSEPEPGRYDFASLTSRVRAAPAQGMQVIWDIMHFGWPEHVDIFAADFSARFAAYAGAVAEYLAREGREAS